MAILTTTTVDEYGQVTETWTQAFDPFGPAVWQEERNKVKFLNVDTVGGEIDVLYGKAKLPARIIFTDSDGDDYEYLHVAMVFCDGNVEGLDTDLWQDAAGGSTSALSFFMDNLALQAFGTDTESSDSSKSEISITDPLEVKVYFNNGQGTDALQPSYAHANWDSGHKLLGLASAYVRLKYKEGYLESLPNFSAIIKGKKCLKADLTTAWSENPADILHDYLRSATYGKGLSADDIDSASFQAAATYCSTDVDLTPTSTGARKTINGENSTSNS